MKIIQSIIILFLFFTISCKNKKEIESKEFDYQLNFKELKYPDGQENIKDIDYIPLETTDSSLISSIDKIEFENDKYYILDKTINSILIFNDKGKFEKKLNKIGKGPGEYITIFDFDVSKDSKIWIYDNAKSKMIIYDHDFTFVEHKLKFHFESFIINDSENIIVRNLYSNGNIHNRIALYNIINNNYSALFDLNDYPDEFDLPRYGNILYKSNNSSFITPRFSNKIYKYENNNLSTYIQVNDQIPDKTNVKEFMNHSMDRSALNFIFSISDIYETKSHIHLKIWKSDKIYPVILSKFDNKSFFLKLSAEELYFGDGVIKGVANDYYISYFSLYEYMLSDEFNNKVLESSLDKRYKDILTNITLYDNPVLILLSF